MATNHWPLFDVRVSAGPVTVSAVTDELAMELIETANRGVHDPSYAPFSNEWTDLAQPERGYNSLRFYWRSRVEASPSRWHLPLAVMHHGRVIGASDMMTSNFPQLREFETGSWIELAQQGRGFGTWVRLATLALGFVGFDAEYALTSAWQDNHASLAVTSKLGYEKTGTSRCLRRGEPYVLEHFAMDRSYYFENHHHKLADQIAIEGVSQARTFLGL